jgi:hypothetical protein
MENVHQYRHGTQAQQRTKQHESRSDRTILYPVRNKRESRQSDYCGVVRLSSTGKRYWVNLWTADPYRLRLSEKDGLGLKTPISRLSPVGEGCRTGQLLLNVEDAFTQLRLRVWLRETDQRWLEVHFETIFQKEDR